MWRDEKQNREVESEKKQSREVESEESKLEDRIHLRERQQKQNTSLRSVRKVANCCAFSMISDVEKRHATVARSTFASQNVQNTPWLDDFLKFKC